MGIDCFLIANSLQEIKARKFSDKFNSNNSVFK